MATRAKRTILTEYFGSERDKPHKITRAASAEAALQHAVLHCHRGDYSPVHVVVISSESGFVLFTLRRMIGGWRILRG